MTNFAERLDLGDDGLRVAIKDVIDIAGLQTRCGSRALAGVPPAIANAAVVDRLLAAGCRIVGKTVLHELAFGVTGINNWAGTPVNPQYPDLIPGGSSSGSAAAVAAGDADFALGSDTGGSIRVPAVCCGVIGFKPSFGRVDRTGASPAATSLDCIGPLARQMETILCAMDMLDPTFVAEQGERWRIARLMVPADPAIDRAVDAALAASDLTCEPIEAPDMRAAFEAALTIINQETYAAFGHLLSSGLVDEDVAVRLKRAEDVSVDEVAAAERVRLVFRRSIDQLLERFDVLALPTLPIVPPRLDDVAADRAALSLTALVRPFNLSGHPALSLPIRTADGCPAGLQIVAKRGDDALLCAVGLYLERALSARFEGDSHHE
ncbi:amidase [Sphingopyxis sp. MSC1_008]|jgi:amidase|uniref:amidase n=1 Tax=Sphingopyxis sp. MSC1_008 TaxID=2909265 RepID=UPI0020BFC498|nr:amidase [Sphingopyxis sp. MSC1_008]